MHVVAGPRSVVGGPIMARRDVVRVTGGGCAFIITGSTGGARVGGTMRTVFKMGMRGIGALGCSKGIGEVNERRKEATDFGGTMIGLATSDGRVRFFRKVWLAPGGQEERGE